MYKLNNFENIVNTIDHNDLKKNTSCIIYLTRYCLSIYTVFYSDGNTNYIRLNLDLNYFFLENMGYQNTNLELIFNMLTLVV